MQSSDHEVSELLRLKFALMGASSRARRYNHDLSQRLILRVQSVDRRICDLEAGQTSGSWPFGNQHHRLYGGVSPRVRPMGIFGTRVNAVPPEYIDFRSLDLEMIGR